MNPFQLMDTFRTELQAVVNETIQQAVQAQSVEDERWDAYLRSHDVVPKTSEERKQLLLLTENKTKGALPIEVRQVLEKHKTRATKKLTSLQLEFGKEEWWPRVETPTGKIIHDFIEEGIKKYVGELAPKTSLGQSIFANSKKTTTTYMTKIYQAGTKSEKCPTCMAARPAESDLKTCAFCGTTVFNT
jgi:hypothetical protein